MANKFGLGSLSLETKKPNTTAWINKAKPYFVDQIGDPLQGDLDMNNFSITNLKSPENDNDAIHKKYLMEQLNLIEVNKGHLNERIGDVKRFFKRQLNNKDFIDDTKLQQEVKVDSIFFRQNPGFSSKPQFNARKVLQFINGTTNVETKELEINDENTKRRHLYEIKTSGKYIDRFRMLIIPDNEEDVLSLNDFDMILETETPPSARQIEIVGEITQDGKYKQDMKFVGFNTKTFVNFFATVDEKSDASDWYFTGKIIFRKNNFKEIKRSKKGSGVSLLKKIKEYIGINCYIPSDGCCFVKCVNHVLNKDYTREFQDFINSFQKSNRKGVMTSARICEFNKKFNTNFQIYMPKHRHFQPKKVTEELDWVFYLHKEHFCLIRRNNKALKTYGELVKMIMR
ncbi:hypothetical protein LOTGIDRAFT_175785 [Lottia gigantea]|uniref:Uncharacterized protein n=1 Tax=Lottia gigantea TaxID=225164 RepID=V4A7E1_LOTGI|nr:hypothetical protein LOTGIDRAFT_175785 [Lottia gigantea]ESO90925.1 hypothetical protein LOTGIDRAFT_175785 [Lottia gigantea]